MTTRSLGVALGFAHDKNIIHVEPMSDHHASLLLQKKLDNQPGNTPEPRDALKLVEALEFIPLAIIQAAAYINRLSPLRSVAKYLEEFQRSERRRVRLLQHEAGHPDRDIEARNSILLTWQLSFNDIQENHPSAAELLSVMSFFDKSGIPWNILQKADPALSEEDDASSVASSNLHESLCVLKNYSLISLNVEKETCDMHRLVQLATRKWLESHEGLESWRSRFLEHLSSAFPTDTRNISNWPLCQSLLPHVQSALSQEPASIQDLRKWSSLLLNTVDYAQENGNYSAALEISTQSLKTSQKRFGPADHQALSHMWSAEYAYRRVGNHSEARKLMQDFIQSCEEYLGSDHPSILWSKNRLLLNTSPGKRSNQVLEMWQSLLESYQRVYGVESPDCLPTMENMYQSLSAHGRGQDAIQICRKMVNISERVFGAKHSLTLNYMTHLAFAYTVPGQWDKFRNLQEKIYHTKQQCLGQETLDLFEAMADMGNAYLLLNDTRLAEPLLERSYEGTKRILGPESPGTVRVLESMTTLWKQQGRYDDAVQMRSHCVGIWKKLLGNESQEFKESSMTLNSWLQDQIVFASEEGDYAEVERLLLKGANINHKDIIWGRSALSKAAETNSTDTILFLLKKGADPNSPDICGSSMTQDNNGRTPLIWAAICGRPEAARALVDHHADTALEDKDGRTALSWASGRGHPAVVEILLETNTPINQPDRFREQTPLSWAAMQGRPNVVRVLLQHGADNFS